MSDLTLHLHLTPLPSGEDVERIEDLIASTLWRHGWRGALESDATGNTVTLKFSRQADDGRGYPRAETGDSDAPDHQREFTFDYRDGELTATIFAASSNEAWQKLMRHIGGISEPGVTISVGSAQLHPCYWAETTEESDEAIEDDDDGEDWSEPPVPALDAHLEMDYEDRNGGVGGWDE